MKFKSAAVAAILAASSTYALAQSTGTENNATSGSGASSMEQQGKTGSDNKDGKSTSTGMEMKGEKPTSAGTSNNQAKDLRGHSETPSTGGK